MRATNPGGGGSNGGPVGGQTVEEAPEPRQLADLEPGAHPAGVAEAVALVEPDEQAPELAYAAPFAGLRAADHELLAVLQVAEAGSALVDGRRTLARR